MRFRNILTQSIMLPISDKILGFSISKSLEFLLKSQWWSREELDEYQNERLKALIYHVYETVPYYNNLFKQLKLQPSDIKTKSDLNKLPIITKATFKREGINKFTSTAFDKKKLVLGSSSGSTGEPFQYFNTRECESFQKAAGIRSWYWMGYRLGDKYVKISMNPRSSKLKLIQDIMNNSLYLSSKKLEAEIFLSILDEIKHFNPMVIRCYPVPLNFLANMAANLGGIELNRLSAISTTGSTLHSKIRNNIETIFQTKIYDSYSCEGGAVFAQCEKNKFYHSAEEYSISEFIEDDFTRNDAEKAKRHITTDLVNYAVPFIRYDTQDYVVITDKKECECGRKLLVVKKIKGRDSDVLITPSGRYLIVENFVAYFEWIPSIEQFQVYQEKINLIRMRFIVNKLFTNKVKKEIFDYWTNYIGKDVELVFDIVDEIKLTPTGKRRNVIRNPSIKLAQW